MTDFDARGIDISEAPGGGGVDEPPRPPETPDRPRRRRPRKSSARRVVIEWVILIGSALLIALLIKTFLFQAFYIPSESMYPTLKKGDRILVNKVSYKVHDVNRGDIVVFETPKGEDSSIKDLVKRVIALPGETIETRRGQVFINGRRLDEPYLQDGVETCARNTAPPNCDKFGPITVGKNKVFVMGDNREQSKDGRFFPAPNTNGIDESSIVGRVFIRIWPILDVGFL